ncbi:hypothetical protein BZA77DRAFT_292053 [Pyronema omphalodes]|nr:hypothetical protein BZA77DRAFT_292053 [Pyronema omphalodes]
MSGYNEYLNAGNNNRPTHRLSGIREQGTLSQRIHEWQSRVENVPPPAATRAMAGSRAPPSNFSDLRSASTGVSASSRGGGSTRFNDGRFNDGRFNDGRFNDGRFNDGRFNNGRFDGERFDYGRFDDGRFNDGRFDDGRFNNGKIGL